MSVSRVLYDFEAQESGELTVEQGESVRIVPNQISQDSGWIMVEQINSPFKKGYVPSGYLSEPIKNTNSPSSASRLLQHKSSQRNSSDSNQKVSEGMKSPLSYLSGPRVRTSLGSPLSPGRRLGSSKSFLGSPVNISQQFNGSLRLSSNKKNASGPNFSLFSEMEDEIVRSINRNRTWCNNQRDADARREEDLEQSLQKFANCLTTTNERVREMHKIIEQGERELAMKRERLRKVMN